MMSDASDYNDVIVQSIIDAELGLYDGEATADAILRLLDDCLDVEVHVVYSASSTSTETRRIQILRSYGGPTTRIELDAFEPGYVIVYTLWGSERAERRIFAPELCSVAEEAAGYILDEVRERNYA